MLPGLLGLLLLQCAGAVIKIATGTVLPGPVIGLLLLLVLLIVRGLPRSLEKAGDALLGQLGLLFVPPAVGLFFLGPRLAGQWTAIFASSILATIATLLFSAALMQRLLRDDRGAKRGPAVAPRAHDRQEPPSSP